MIKKIRKQTLADLYKETFATTIKFIGESNFKVAGKKIYIILDTITISLEFIGTDLAFNILYLNMFTKHGVIDQNVTPLTLILKKSEFNKENKYIKIIQDAAAWSEELDVEDLNALNALLLNYITVAKNI